MLTKIRKWADHHHLFKSGEQILAACSGGPDSLALVHVLMCLRAEYQFTLAVAHVNHLLRGQESAADARFVAAFCEQNGLPCYTTEVDVNKCALESGRSIEDAARVLRYSWLRKVALDIGGAQIATGHHRDDQAETVLMHLLRGAGSAGLTGMEARKNGIVRPFLAVSRKEIMEYCIEQGLKPRIDSSNAETNFLRNRIRLCLLPLLEHEYNPAVKEALERTAVLIGDEHDFIRQSVLKVWPQIITQAEDSISVDCEKLAKQHIAVQREIFRLAIEKKQGSLTGISFHHVEKLIHMAQDASVGSRIELPGGLLAKKGYTELKFGLEQEQSVHASIPGTEIKVPGRTFIPLINKSISAELHETMPRSKGVQSAVFDWQALAPPLYVRTRLPGDRFQPLGLNGTKKLKDFFIDIKVPRQERDKVLLVCDGDGIIWVSGYRQAERGKVASHTGQFLQLTIEETMKTGGTTNDS